MLQIVSLRNMIMTVKFENSSPNMPEMMPFAEYPLMSTVMFTIFKL